MSSRFRAAVEAKDLEAMQAALHPDVVFRSPAVHTPYEGRDKTLELLRHVVEVFEDFRYIGDVEQGNTQALIFAARVGDKELQGLDLVKTDGDGLITELTVMVRPLSGLIALAQAMAARLQPASS